MNILAPEILNWHEGSKITDFHRMFVASIISFASDHTEDDAAVIRREFMQVPESLIAEGMAAAIAIIREMSQTDFKRAFPDISSSQSALIIDFARSLPRTEVLIPEAK